MTATYGGSPATEAFLEATSEGDGRDDEPAVIEGELTDGRMPDGSEPPDCLHPPQDRRLEDGEQICLLCGMPVPGPLQPIIAKDRPGGEDPTRREGDARSGGLRHVNYSPEQAGGDRPYTPDQIEREIVDTLDRIERGAGWLTTKEEERAAAKLAYELAYARSMLGASGRSESMRQAEALNANRELYADWQNLELVCRTAREGMHNLRSKLSGLQTVSRSIGAALGAYR